MKKYKDESNEYLDRLRDDINRIDHKRTKMSDSLVKKCEELKDKGSKWFYFEYIDGYSKNPYSILSKN